MGVWRNFFIMLAAFILVIVLINTDFGNSGGRYYDCRDAHLHPDVPIEVKQRCAELFYEEWKRIQEEERAKKVIRT